MLKEMKNSSEKFFVKLIFGLISASFIFFGFVKSDFGADSTVLSVAGTKVSAKEFDEELRRQIAQIRRILGNTRINYKQALQMGFVDQIIDNLAYRILLDKEAKELGIEVSNEKIYEIIKATKEFQDDKGNFSPEQFAYILEVNNISENKFVSELSKQIAREILINSIMSNVDNSMMAEILYKNDAQKRTFDVVSFKVANEVITEQPKDDELKEIYEINSSKFIQPEFRKISYILITPEMARKYRDIKKSDDDKTYKTMIEMGEDIIDEINGGAKVEDTVKTFGVSKVVLPDLNVDGKKRDGSAFNDKTFTQKFRDIAFFALDEKGISDVLDNGENIMLVMVDAVYPSKPKSFESVKGEIKNIWKRTAQIAQASQKVNKISTLLDNGEKFNDAVKKVDTKANVILNTTSGRFNNLYTTNFLSKLFNTEKDKPFVIKSDDIYYVAVLRDISLPEIKDKAEFEKFKEQKKEAFAGIIVDDYISYLYKKYGVKRYDKMLNRLFN